MNIEKLLETAEQIITLKGGRGSGNWAHDGRPGKKGGSTKGGGLRRIGAKKDTPPGDRKKAAREFRSKRVPKKVEETIGDSFLGAEFSYEKLIDLKRLDRNAYDRAIETGIKRMGNDLEDAQKDIKYFGGRADALKKQRKKALADGKPFNPNKERELELSIQRKKMLEENVKELESLLKSVPGKIGNGRIIETKSAVDLAWQIMLLRGGPTSGNWGHQGRPGKKGGSKRGAGFKAIGVRDRPNLKREDVKRKAKKAKEQLTSDVNSIYSHMKMTGKTKDANTFYQDISSARQANAFTLSQAQALANKFEKEQAKNHSKTAQASFDKKKKSPKSTGKGTPQVGALRKTATEISRDEAVKTYDSFHKNATKEENKAMVRYQGSGYQGMNGHLRFGNSISDADKENIKQLDKAIDKAPRLSKDAVLYRGSGYQAYADQLGDDPNQWAGKVFEDKGYMSTTRDSNKAFSGVPAEIRAPKGTKTVYFGELPGGPHNYEEEFLMARGTKMVVTGVEMGGPNGNWVQKVYTEVIEQP